MSKATLLVALLVALTAGTAQAKVCYVDTGGDDNLNGLAPDFSGINGPKRTIQAAINDCAVDGDVISIEAGTYGEFVNVTKLLAFEARQTGSVTLVSITEGIQVSQNTTFRGNSVGGFSEAGFLVSNAPGGAGPADVVATTSVDESTAALFLAGSSALGVDDGFTGGRLQIAAGGRVIRNDEASVNGTITYNGAANLFYVDTDGDDNNVVAGGELPTALGAGSVVVEIGGNTLTLPAQVTVSGGTVTALGASDINGTFVLNTGALTIMGPGNVGSITQNGGTVTVGGTTGVDNVNISAGTFTLGANTLTITGSFNRPSGTFTASTGTLAFVGNNPATFEPGPNFSVGAVTVAGTRTLQLLNDVDVTSAGVAFSVANATTLDMGSRSINVRGSGTVDIDGTILNLPTGGVVFATPGTLQGQGTYGNIFVTTGGRVTVPAGAANSDGDVEFAGILTINAGGLNILGDLSPTGDDALVRVNVATAANPPVIGTGTFNGNDALYNITYIGAMPGALMAGLEFDTDFIRNVAFDMTGVAPGEILTLPVAPLAGGVTVASIEGNLSMAEDVLVALPAQNVGVRGTLTVADDAVLSGGNAANSFSLLGNNTTHSVVGSVTAASIFTINGTGITVNGSTSTDNEATLANLTVAGNATATVTNIHVINGDVVVGIAGADNATLALTMAHEQDIAGNLTVQGAGFTLGSNVDVAGNVNVNSGSFAFGANDLNVTGDFTSAGSVTYTANTGSTAADRGELVLLGAGNFTTGGATIQNVRVNGARTLTNDTVISAALVETGAGSLVFGPGADSLRVSGELVTDGAAIVTGAGRVLLGTTTVTMGGNPRIDPSAGGTLEVVSGATVTLASTTAAQRTLFLDQGTLLLRGTLALGGQILHVFDAGGPHNIVNGGGGAVTGLGFLAISGGDIRPGGETFNISNLAIIEPTTIGTVTNGQVRITQTLRLEDNLDEFNSAEDNLAIGDGATIIRAGGMLIDDPTFDGVVDVVIDVASTTGREVPGNSQIRNLTVNAALLTDRNVTVTGTLTLANTLTEGVNTAFVLGNGATLVLQNGANIAGTIGATNYNIVYDRSIDTTIGSLSEFIAGATVTSLTVSMNGGAVLSLGADRTINNLVVESGTLAFGPNDLTVRGSLNVTGGNLTATVGADADLILGGSAAQAVTVPGAGLTLADLDLRMNNPAGATLSGGSIVLSDANSDLELLQGVLTVTGNSFIQIFHVSTADQGYTQAVDASQNVLSVVNGNIRKEITNNNPGGTVAPANRIDFPLGIPDVDGDNNSLPEDRSAAITINDPAVVTSLARSGIFLNALHVTADPGGNNRLPVVTTDADGNPLSIVRRPPFFWLITSTSTLSPSAAYDIELEADGYAAFVDEEIEDVRIIRRQNGNINNPWTVVGTGPQDYEHGQPEDDHPIVTVRNATGAIVQAPGAIFTYGLKSNLELPAIADQTLSVGQAPEVVALNIAGGTLPLQRIDVTSSNTNVATVTSSTAGSGSITITPVSVGTSEVIVTIVDALNDTRSDTFAVNVVGGLTVRNPIGAQSLNAGDEFSVRLDTVIVGGVNTQFTVASSDSSVAVATITGGVLTVSADSAGTATITVTATDDNGLTLETSFTVNVNAAFAAGTIPNIPNATSRLRAGGTATVDLTGVFTGGTGPFTCSATSGNAAQVTGALSNNNNTLTLTGVSASQAGPAVQITVTCTDATGAQAASTFTVVVNPRLGDVNVDGSVTAIDAALVLQFAANQTTLTANQLTASDVSGNGSTTAFDAALILQFAADLRDDFPAEGGEAGKRDLEATGDVAWGTAIVQERNITLPIMLENEVANVYAVTFKVNVDAEAVTFTSAASAMPNWQIVSHLDKETGVLTVTMAGTQQAPVGEIATLKFEMVSEDAKPTFRGEGYVNENSSLILDEIETKVIPTESRLDANYPNPFNPSTTISYRIPEKAQVVLQIFDVAGRLVQTLVNAEQEAGIYNVRWDARNAAGEQVASGLYLYRVKAGSFVDTKTMLLVK